MAAIVAGCLSLGSWSASGQPAIAPLNQLAPASGAGPAATAGETTAAAARPRLAWVRMGLPGQGQSGGVPMTEFDLLTTGPTDETASGGSTTDANSLSNAAGTAASGGTSNGTNPARPLGPVLRLRAQAAYGSLVHALHPPWVPTPGTTLQWRWRVDQSPQGADLTRKAGDDVAVKVCVLFDLPLARVPFVERQLLRLARQRTAQELPAATVCYVWDRNLGVGQQLDNVYSRRVRQRVLSGATTPLRQWREARVQPHADFLTLFGDEAAGTVPAITAIAIGADTDNTSSSSLAWVADVRWGSAAD